MEGANLNNVSWLGHPTIYERKMERASEISFNCFNCSFMPASIGRVSRCPVMGISENMQKQLIRHAMYTRIYSAKTFP